MDQCDQAQLQVPLRFGPAHQPASKMIEPCATVYNEVGKEVPGVFHLLVCGHIVAVDEEKDRRCGRNCEHAAATFRALSEIEERQPITSTSTQHIDILHCETCYGIPFDRYRLLIAKEQPSTLRRSLALTYPLLQATLVMNSSQVSALLCWPFFYPAYQGFDWYHTHRLLCGHRVWTIAARPCAANCMLEPGCRGASSYDGHYDGRETDAILCHECVTRAELVFRRYAKLEEEPRDGEESGYVSAAAQVTSEHDSGTAGVGDDGTGVVGSDA